MRALSIKQPWLWCITEFDKRIENRTWKPPDWIAGQTIALHASKTTDRGEFAAANRIVKQALDWAKLDGRMPFGAIVATAVISGWVSQSGGFSTLDNKWFVGPYGWVLTGVRKLPEPILCKGALGLWKVPDDVLVQMRAMKHE